LCPDSTICGSGEDHASLELRQGPKHGEDQLVMGASGVQHGIGDRAEASTPIRNCGQAQSFTIVPLLWQS